MQLRLVLELAGADGNVTAVGDEDQGIYRWRGADLDNILDFEGRFPGATVRKLERNYRSTQNILSAAGAVVANNKGRRGKTLWTEAGDGELLELYKARDEQDEARWIVNTLQGLRGAHQFSEMGVLVRTNAQTRVLEEELLRQQVPYVLVAGVRFYERAEIKDLVAYLRLMRNPRDNVSLLRILNRPTRGIGKATQAGLEEQARIQGITLWDVLETDALGGFSNRASKALRTFHEMISRLQVAARSLTLPELLEQLLEDTGYPDLYRKEDPEAQAKLENLREFVSAVQEFTEKHGEGIEQEDLLTAFLDHASLVSDIDGWHPERGVSVMTLHSAKGLEFPIVFLPGLEHGLLPHFNAGGSLEDIEEERRLLYVGMTRAEKRLFLSTCRRRRIAGRYQDQVESEFVTEIPVELVHVTESPELFRTPSARGVYSFFGRQENLGNDLEAVGEFGALTVKRGARVRHASLGEGVVMGFDGAGEDAKLTVFFDHAGKRKLIAKYANLELI